MVKTGPFRYCARVTKTQIQMAKDMQLPEIFLHYGGEQPLGLTFDADRFRSFHAGPSGVPDVSVAVLSALSEPCEYPPVTAMCVPGDRMILLLDRQVPQAASLVSQLIPMVCESGVDPTQLTILQPAHWHHQTWIDPRSELPENLRKDVQWKIHDPTANDSTGYLATSSTGERIYLARDILDADLVLPVFTAGFDSVLGYRSVGSLLFPGLSNVEAFTKALGEGHRELRPEDDRPLRQLGEEICWLLGVQFALGVVPGREAESLAAIWAGQWEAVQRKTRQFIDHAWKVSLDQRAETVVLSVSGRSGFVSWEEIGAALEVAQNLVLRDGRIVLLSSLSSLPGPGMEILRSSRSPKAALQRMRKESPPDLVASAQVASAIAWAKVSLLSQLETSLVEDLLLTPLTSTAEVERLIATADDVVLVNAGEHVSGEIVEE